MPGIGASGIVTGCACAGCPHSGCRQLLPGQPLLLGGCRLGSGLERLSSRSMPGSGAASFVSGGLATGRIASSCLATGGCRQLLPDGPRLHDGRRLDPRL